MRLAPHEITALDGKPVAITTHTGEAVVHGNIKVVRHEAIRAKVTVEFVLKGIGFILVVPPERVPGLVTQAMRQASCSYALPEGERLWLSDEPGAGDATGRENQSN